MGYHGFDGAKRRSVRAFLEGTVGQDQNDKAYEPPRVTDLGTLEELTKAQSSDATGDALSKKS